MLRPEKPTSFLTSRGERAKALNSLKLQAPVTQAAANLETASGFASRAKATWARLIRKAYETDPLVCAKRNGPVREERAD